MAREAIYSFAQGSDQSIEVIQTDDYLQTTIIGVDGSQVTMERATFQRIVAYFYQPEEENEDGE